MLYELIKVNTNNFYKGDCLLWVIPRNIEEEEKLARKKEEQEKEIKENNF